MIENSLRRKLASKMLQELRAKETRDRITSWYLNYIDSHEIIDKATVSELLNLAETIGILVVDKTNTKHDICKKQLEELIKAKTIKEIAEIYNVSQMTIARKIKAYGI